MYGYLARKRSGRWNFRACADENPGVLSYTGIRIRRGLEIAFRAAFLLLVCLLESVLRNSGSRCSGLIVFYEMAGTVCQVMRIFA